jgi:hypothetical protein
MDPVTGTSLVVAALGLAWKIASDLSQHIERRRLSPAQRVREASAKLKRLLESRPLRNDIHALRLLVSEIESLKKEYPEVDEIRTASVKLAQDIRELELDAALDQLLREMLAAQTQQQLLPISQRLEKLSTEYGELPVIRNFQAKLGRAIQQHESNENLRADVAPVELLQGGASLLFSPDASCAMRLLGLLFILLFIGLISIFFHC